MQTTTYYGLKKPEATDLYNIQDMNDNVDRIDTLLKELNTGCVPLTGGTMQGALTANATAVSALGVSQMRNICAGTTELVAGTTALAPGEIYVQLKV